MRATGFAQIRFLNKSRENVWFDDLQVSGVESKGGGNNGTDTLRRTQDCGCQCGFKYSYGCECNECIIPPVIQDGPGGGSITIIIAPTVIYPFPWSPPPNDPYQGGAGGGGGTPPPAYVPPPPYVPAVVTGNGNYDDPYMVRQQTFDLPYLAGKNGAYYVGNGVYYFENNFENCYNDETFDLHCNTYYAGYYKDLNHIPNSPELKAITKSTGLTPQQEKLLDNALKEILNNCLDKALYNYLVNNGIKFNFKMNVNTQGEANYNYTQ